MFGLSGCEKKFKINLDQNPLKYQLLWLQIYSSLMDQNPIFMYALDISLEIEKTLNLLCITNMINMINTSFHCLKTSKLFLLMTNN